MAALTSLAVLAVVPVLAGCQSKGTGSSSGTPDPSASASAVAVALASAFPAPPAGTKAPRPAAKGSRGPLVIGSAGFTESEVMVSLYSGLLTAAGYKVSVTREPATDTLEHSLERGDVWVVPQYAGSYTDQLNTLVHGATAKPLSSGDLDATMAQLAALGTARGVHPLKPAAATDQVAFAVTTKLATKNQLVTMSDLGRLGVPIKLAAAADCPTDPYCQPGLLSTYGITVGTFDALGLDTQSALRAVVNRNDQVAQVLTTDYTISDHKMVVLTDDKHLQRVGNVLPVVTQRRLASHPDIATVLNRLAAVLTTDDLALLDRLVDAGHHLPDDVAKAYLTSKNLV